MDHTLRGYPGTPSTHSTSSMLTGKTSATRAGIAACACTFHPDPPNIPDAHRQDFGHSRRNSRLSMNFPTPRRLLTLLFLFFCLNVAHAIPAPPEGDETWNSAADVVEVEVLAPRRQTERREGPKPGWGRTTYQQDVKVVMSYKGSLKAGDLISLVFEESDLKMIPGDGWTSLEIGAPLILFLGSGSGSVRGLADPFYSVWPTTPVARASLALWSRGITPPPISRNAFPPTLQEQTTLAVVGRFEKTRPSGDGTLGEVRVEKRLKGKENRARISVLLPPGSAAPNLGASYILLLQPAGQSGVWQPVPGGALIPVDIPSRIDLYEELLRDRSSSESQP